MGIFFRKSVKIAPGVRLNFGKRGTSVSIGPRGAKVNFSKRGTYLSTSIPGTGIYMREKISGGKANQRYVSNKQSDIDAINKNPLRFCVIFICFLLAVTIPILGGGSWWFFPGFVIGGIVLGCLIPSQKDCPNDTTYQASSSLINENNSMFKSKEFDLKTIETVPQPLEVPIKQINTEPIILPDSDSLFDEAARLIVIQQQGSTSLIQRKFAIGYNRAGRLMDLLEIAGIVGAFEGSRAREVFIKNEEDLEQILNRIQIKECTESDYKEDSAINQAIIDAENSSRLIPIAQSLEKEGMVDEAIAVYEKCILSKIPTTVPYDRLMILYRKKKDYENEIRVIKDAISVFMAENERRAGRVIEGDSSLYNEVMQALETNESIRYDDGKWAFVQYNVMDYITRLEKAKKLNEKSKNKLNQK